MGQMSSVGLQYQTSLKSVIQRRKRHNRLGTELLPETAFLQHAVFSQFVQGVISEISSKQ
jgi:hypothetical protein